MVCEGFELACIGDVVILLADAKLSIRERTDLINPACEKHVHVEGDVRTLCWLRHNATAIHISARSNSMLQIAHTNLLVQRHTFRENIMKAFILCEL